MTNKWKPTQHTVSDIIEWKQDSKLIIKPDFQRHVVWSESAQISLVESILEGFPIPKILLSRNMKDEKTVRTVIDGQQRITAILSFYENKFPLKKPYKGELQNKLFREFPKSAQEKFLDYQLDINEILRPSEEPGKRGLYKNK